VEVKTRVAAMTAATGTRVAVTKAAAGTEATMTVVGMTTVGATTVTHSTGPTVVPVPCDVQNCHQGGLLLFCNLPPQIEIIEACRPVFCVPLALPSAPTPCGFDTVKASPTSNPLLQTGPLGTSHSTCEWNGDLHSKYSVPFFFHSDSTSSSSFLGQSRRTGTMKWARVLGVPCLDA